MGKKERGIGAPDHDLIMRGLVALVVNLASLLKVTQCIQCNHIYCGEVGDGGDGCGVGWGGRRTEVK